MRHKVLVTDGEQRAALAVTRSLGRAGWDVHVCSARASSIAGSSRYCTAHHRVPDPLRDPRGFLSAVTSLAARTKPDVLIPISEAALLSILPHRDGFACAIPFPAADAFEAICDKSKVLRIAAGLGIAVPSQTELLTPHHASSRMSEIRFPAVIKPSRSIAGKEGQRVRAGVFYAGDSSSLHAGLDRIPANAYPVLIQQQIKGPGFGISVLVWDGRLIAAFAHRRIREKPPSGGVSVLRESIPLDREVLSRSLEVLAAFGWKGVAMVEYKLDSQSGVPYLMEINGRLWGSLQLAIDAGVDFPVLLADLAVGRQPLPVTNYPAGVRSRWEWGDVDNLVATMRGSSPHASSEAERPPRLAAVRDFIRGLGPANRPEVFRLDDPLPILRETIDWFLRR